MTGSINSNMFNRKRRLIEIKEIQIPQDQLEQIRQFRESRSNSWSTEYLQFLRRTTRTGVCCICNDLPQKLATFKVGTAVMVERYCDSCFHHLKDDLTTNGLNEKIVIKYR
jgi:hypothetical protein